MENTACVEFSQLCVHTDLKYIRGYQLKTIWKVGELHQKFTFLTRSDLKYDFDFPPKPLHRLDYSTSGCLILGRTDRAAKQFSSALANNKITKEYWGLVENMDRVYHDEGVVDHPISLSSLGKPYIGGDKKALTQWQVLRHNVGDS